MAATARFEDHVGELELTLEADSLEEIFTEAARVVSRECGEPAGPAGAWEGIRLSARDPVTLLADWLNELIGRSEVEARAYDDVRDLTLSGSDGGESIVLARLRGRPVGSWESALKAATYHRLELKRTGERWTARVIFDV